MIVIILICSCVLAMERPNLTAQQAKEIVKQYVNDKEGSYIKQQQATLKEQQAAAKDSNYHKHTDTTMPGVVGLPPASVEKEIGPALVDILDGVGYVCADNKVFLIMFDTEKQSYRVKKYLNLTGKVEHTDRTQPSVAALKAARLQGGGAYQVLLGEYNGRLLIGDIINHKINTFGKASDKITEIIPHPAGTHVAVKYLQAAADDARKKIPCVAASKAYLALQDSSKKTGSYLAVQNVAGNRGSWLPQGYSWSPMVTKECAKGIDGIRWENNDLLIQCSESKKWERYSVANDALVEIENVLP